MPACNAILSKVKQLYAPLLRLFQRLLAGRCHLADGAFLVFQLEPLGQGVALLKIADSFFLWQQQLL